MYGVLFSRRIGVLVCLGALTFLSFPVLPAGASPFPGEPVQFDWVCVTDGPLVPAYEMLAEHRRGQGLTAVVLTLEEVILWSPAGDDTTATLRWLAQTAHQQWQARYLVLGGSHALLPAPIHRLISPIGDYDNPTDAYYSCLDGEWDVDGDGLVAEWGEDAADPTVHLGLGRLPADEPEAAASLVAKILAYEHRRPAFTGGALFVASLMDPYWEPEASYPNAALGIAMQLRDTVADAFPELRISTLYQSDGYPDPYNDPLNPVALADSLAAAGHDLVHIQLMTNPEAWQLVEFLTVRSEDFASLAGTGNLFIGIMTSAIAADTREPGILQTLLTMSDGGAAAFIAPSGMGYLYPQTNFQQELWRRLLDGSCQRLGDAFREALDSFFTVNYESSPNASTYWTLCLLGDPATLLQTTATAAPAPLPAVQALNLRAAPNPFNPRTEISFEIAGPEGRARPVRVEVFDVRGRLVEVLLDRDLPPGPRRLPWQPRASSGVYFVRVDVAGHTSTAKLTLLE